jgi:hypothetical protein
LVGIFFPPAQYGTALLTAWCQEKKPSAVSRQPSAHSATGAAVMALRREAQAGLPLRTQKLKADG